MAQRQYSVAAAATLPSLAPEGAVSTGKPGMLFESGPPAVVRLKAD
jgi:hypothetical protein